MPRYPFEIVTDTIRARILDGTYPPGSKLPSRRELCTEFGLSDPVIGAAQRILKQEGLIVGLTGAGVYVVEQLPGERGGPAS
jgi:GntR family transcriptional regulator